MRSRALLVAIVAASLLLSGCFGSAPTATPSPSPSAVPTASTAPTASPSPTSTPTASPSPAATAPATASPTPLPTPTPSALVTYTVRAGDTLGTIAAAHATTWQSLVYWNREAYPSLDPEHETYDPNHLSIGWTLRLQPGVVVDYAAPLPVVPTAAPAPSPATGVVVTNGSRVGDALAIMSWLRDHAVHATIFMTGALADSTATDAGRLVLARIDARPDLFGLGNHTYTHPHLTALTPAQIVDELLSAEAAIDRHASSSPRPFFRPPFGEWNTAVVDAAASAGYRFTVLWDVDTIDWKPIADGGPTAAQIVDKVVARAEGGSIVLMHLGGYETLEALPGIVSGLRARGLELVTLGEMLGG
jgi:hypothetical protein